MSVLLATKVKDAEIWLPRFISQVEEMDCINEILVMYGQSRDKSYAYLDHWRNTSKHKITLKADPYIPPQEQHGAMLARVKQDIQKYLAESGHEYYCNLDCDLVRIPFDFIPELMVHDKDVIASMNWIEGRDPPVFFDTYEFRKDGLRFHPFNPPGAFGGDPFEVDSVSTCYLAKAEAELAGVYGNPYPHIPFCMDLKLKGYKIWVDPLIDVYHIDLTALGMNRQPLPVPYSTTPFINEGEQRFTVEQVMAHEHEHMRNMYPLNLMKTDTSYLELHKETQGWLNTRPLITASYKVYGDVDLLKMSIASIYEYMDCIDIITGPISLRSHEGKSGDYEAVKTISDPEKKIRVIDGKWKDKQEIQNKLLEICRSKWMLFIDADEVIDGAAHIREFAMKHRSGSKIYARPKRFINFWYDFHHVAYSLNPANAFAEHGMPHPFLILRDIPGLNFAVFHTIAMDGFGNAIHGEHAASKKDVLDNVQVFHLGNAKDIDELQLKRDFYKARGDTVVYEDHLFTGQMPPDMVIEEYKGWYPDAMTKHPRFGESLIKVVQSSPYYKFEVIK